MACSPRFNVSATAATRAGLRKRPRGGVSRLRSIRPISGSSAPPLDGIGASLTVPQLRLSVVDFSQVAAGRAMPSFHKARGDAAPRLSAQEVEDVVAYLATLRL